MRQLQCTDAAAVRTDANAYNASFCASLDATRCAFSVYLELAAPTSGPLPAAVASALADVPWAGLRIAVARRELAWPRAAVASLLPAMPRLRQLDLSDSGLSSLAPDMLAPLTQVQSLSLRGCPLSDLPVGFLDAAPTLQYLDMAQTQLTQLRPGIFDKLDRLLALDVGPMPTLRTLPDGLLAKQPHIQRLIFFEVGLTTVPADLLSQATELQALSLWRTNIASFPPGFFDKLSRVTQLSLSGNRVGSYRPGAFANMISLTAIGLERNGLTKVPEEVLRLPQLEQLYVGGNLLTDLQLPRLPKLFTLDVSENRLRSAVFADGTPLAMLNASYNEGLSHLRLPLGAPAAGNDSSPSASSVLDLSHTAVKASAVDCTVYGRTTLIARNMLGPGWYAKDLIRECINTPGRRLLDLSGNAGLDEVRAIQQELSHTYYLDLNLGPGSSASAAARLASETLVFVDFLGNSQVARPLPQLLLSGGQVDCALDTHSEELYAPKLTSLGEYRSAYSFVSDATAAAFVCRCIDGFQERNGRCEEKVAWIAQPRGIVTLFFVVSLVDLLLLYAARRGWRHVKAMRANIHLHERLLESAEGEVLALKRAWEIDASEVRLERRIDGGSEGAFGAVWQGDWDGLRVAVKVLRAGLLELDQETADEFEKEADFMMRARHANLVRFFGAGKMAGGEPFLVLELVARGSLAKLLNRGSSGGEGGSSGSAGALSPALQLRLAADVARGMAYIHALDAMHRDLKSGNVLVTEGWRGKVADFGSIRGLLLKRTSRDKDVREARAGAGAGAGADLAMTAGIGTPLYMAPEVIRGEAYGPAADVWSFGVVVWELHTGRRPDLLEEEGLGHGRGPYLSRLLAELDKGKRLRLAGGGGDGGGGGGGGGTAPPWVSSCLAQCFSGDPSQRATFEALLTELEAEPSYSAV